MIASATVSGNTLILRPDNIPNIFPNTSASLIIGEQGAGKTSFLKSVIDGVLGRSGNYPIADVAFSEGHQFSFNEWGVVFYTSCRYSEPLPEHPNLVERFCASFDMKAVLMSYSEFLEPMSIDLQKSYKQMSGGERHLLDIFASIKTSVEALADKNHLLVVLDNPDSGLHPKMQRLLVNNLTGFLSELRKRYDFRDLQLIMTSNSPLVIGDFPRDYVLRLPHKDDQEGVVEFSTFSADLSHLYNRAMGTKTIPVLASDVINKTAENLKNGTYSSLDEYVISQIGNSMIKRELERLKGMMP